MKTIYVGGVHFSGCKFERKSSQFRPSEIHCLRDLTARNGSLDMGQPEM